jgi:hypothetical protein
MRQHTSRQHTPAYASIRQHTREWVAIDARQYPLRTPAASMRQHASAYVSIRQHTSAYASIRMLAYADVC